MAKLRRTAVQIVEGSQILGSGYDLGNGRVLTARHVVKDRAQVLVQREGAAAKEPMEVAWRGEGMADVAVLRPIGDMGAPAAPPTIGFFRGDPRRRSWSARGFLAASGNATAMEGRVMEQQPLEVSCELSVTTTPSQPDLWKGVSGSAVLVDGELLAVLQLASGVFTGKLVGVLVGPISRTDETLRAAIGLQREHEERREYAVTEMERRIAKQPGLRNHLKRGSDAWAIAESDGVRRLVSAILAEPSPVALVDTMRTAMAGLKGVTEGAKSVADELLGVLDLALPVVCGESQDLEHGEDGCWSTPSDKLYPNESRMAWRGQRPVEMTTRSLGPKESLPLPRAYREIYWTPVEGMQAKDRVRVLAGGFRAQIEKLAADYHRDEGGDPAASYEDMLEDLNDAMSKQPSSVDPERTISFYGIVPNVLEPEEQAAFLSSQRAFLRELTSALPGFSVLVPEMHSGGSREDRKLEESIRVLLKVYRTVTEGAS